jgi:hypothetical protein
MVRVPRYGPALRASHVLESFKTLPHPCLDGTQGYAEPCDNLGLGQPVVICQFQELALVLRELCRSHHAPGPLLRRTSRRQRGSDGGGVLSPPPLHPPPGRMSSTRMILVQFDASIPALQVRCTVTEHADYTAVVSPGRKIFWGLVGVELMHVRKRAPNPGTIFSSWQSKGHCTHVETYRTCKVRGDSIPQL